MAQHEWVLLHLLEVIQILDNLGKGRNFISYTYTSPPITEPNGNQRKNTYQLANSMTTQFNLGDILDCTTKPVALRLDEASTHL
jgi:hypothetical protein